MTSLSMDNPHYAGNSIVLFFDIKALKMHQPRERIASESKLGGAFTGPEDPHSGLSGEEIPPSDIIPGTQGVQWWSCFRRKESWRDDGN